MFPDFLCIGAQKAGTTWLHHNLAQQPGIWLPPVKEIHFLDHPPPSLVHRIFSKSSHHRLPRQHLIKAASAALRGQISSAGLAYACRLALAHRSWDWYESLFPGLANTLCGEICPGYARLTAATIEEIARRNPHIKIIYLLRDPLDRAWSSAAMHFRKRAGQSIGETDRGHILLQFKNEKFLSHCRYDANIANWLQFIPPERVYFGFFERIAIEPAKYLADILSFLGIAQPPAAQDPAGRINPGIGEKIDPAIERVLASMLIEEAVRLDARFSNSYTANWLTHARAALG